MRFDTSPDGVPNLGLAPSVVAAMPPAAETVRDPTILVFDSGLGGLTVQTELIAARPDARIVYVADDGGFPYGALDDATLVARILGLFTDLIAGHRPQVAVIACNTASTLVMPHLRAAYPEVQFVGTVPAIKPACRDSRSKHVSVLATPATVRRDYTLALIDEFAGDCRVTLVGSALLAGFAEAFLRGFPVEDEAIAAEIAPCFVEQQGARTDTVVLACTHFPLLLDAFRDLAPWPVDWIDPAPAIARRVVQLIGEAVPGVLAPPGRVVFTAGRTRGPGLARTLRRHRLAEAETAGA